jgi:hypothetical protein
MSLTNGVASVFAILSGYLVIAQGARSTPAATPAPGAEGWTSSEAKGPHHATRAIESPLAARLPPLPAVPAQPAVPYAWEQPPSVVVWVFTVIPLPTGSAAPSSLTSSGRLSF